MTVGDLVLELQDQHPHWLNQQIAEEVLRLIPGSKTSAASVATIKSRDRKWRWPQPDESVLVAVARAVTPLVRFLHPDVVAAVADDNRRRSREWSSRLVDLGIDPGAFLWEGSACAFPGVRRSSGKDEGGGCLTGDGNTYPKHLWAFALTGGRFGNYGPRGYNLAHLFDHKATGGRYLFESDSARDGGRPPKLHGLFTSAANTVFVPKAFESLTDFSLGIRRLLLSRAGQLYGGSCRLLPPSRKLKGYDDPVWTPDAFDWAQAEGTVARIDDFLEFRGKCIAELMDAATRRQAGN